MHIQKKSYLVEAQELAKKIAKKSPIAVKAALEMLQYVKPASYYEGVRAEANVFGTFLFQKMQKKVFKHF